MMAVIFEVLPNDGRKQEYLDIAAELRPHLDEIDGFISIERFESLYESGKILSLSFWRDEVLRALLNAGRRAQSSKNSQPWQFVVVRKPETLRSLSECGQFAGHLAGAAVGVALVSPRKADDFDLGQAAAYMALAAWELGVGCCIAAMWEPDKAKAILGIPDDRHFWAALSFGYPADDWQPAQMGGRKSLDDLVRWERW